MTGPPDIDREPAEEVSAPPAAPIGSGFRLLALAVFGAALVWVVARGILGGGLLMMGGGPDFSSALDADTASAPAMMWDWEATDLAGEPFDFSAHRGEVLFVNLWATWCPPCISEKPTIQELHETLAGEGLRVIAVSMDNDPESPAAFMQARGYTMRGVHSYTAPPFAMNSRGLLLPTSFVVDRTGRVTLVHAGATNWASRDSIAFFRKLLAES